MTVDDNGLISVRVQMTGEINGRSLVGEADAQYRLAENEIVAQMMFKPRYELVAVASSSSHASVFCSIFSRGVFGAVNVSALAGDALGGSADFRVLDLVGRQREEQHVVALVTQEFSAERTGPAEYTMTTNLVGWFDRAYELGKVRSPGYSMHLRQTGRGEIEGVYGQVAVDTDGGAQHVFSRRTYRYSGDEELPFDEVMSYRILDFEERLDEGGTDRETHHVTFRSQAYYAPIEFTRLS